MFCWSLFSGIQKRLLFLTFSCMYYIFYRISSCRKAIELFWLILLPMITRHAIHLIIILCSIISREMTILPSFQIVMPLNNGSRRWISNAMRRWAITFPSTTTSTIRWKRNKPFRRPILKVINSKPSSRRPLTNGGRKRGRKENENGSRKIWRICG